MKALVGALAAVVVLAVVTFAVYVASDGMDCQGDSCSTAADVSGALFYPLVIVAKTVTGAARGSRG